MDAPTPKRTITLGALLELIVEKRGCIHIWKSKPEWGDYACSYREGGSVYYAATPEDALQALAEAVCGPDTLLDLGRSEKWQNEHGPDGVEELEKDAAVWRSIREAMHAARGCIGAMPTAQEFLTEYGHCYERARAVENARRRLEQALGGVGDDAPAAAAEEPLPTSEAIQDAITRAYQKTHPAPEPGEGNEVGLCEGEAGVVVCRDRALVLVEKLAYPDDAKYLRRGPYSVGFDIGAEDGERTTFTIAKRDEQGRMVILHQGEFGPNPDAPATFSDTQILDALEDETGTDESHWGGCGMNLSWPSEKGSTPRQYGITLLTEQAPDPDAPAGREVRPIETSMEEESERDATEESD